MYRLPPSSPSMWLNYVLHISFCTNMQPTIHRLVWLDDPRTLCLEMKSENRKFNGKCFWLNRHIVIKAYTIHHPPIYLYFIFIYIYALNKHNKNNQNWINTNDRINVTYPLTWTVNGNATQLNSIMSVPK